MTDQGIQELPYWTTSPNDPWNNKLSGERLYFLNAECDDDHGKYVIRYPMMTWDEVVNEIQNIRVSAEISRLDVYPEDHLDTVIPETSQTLRERLFGSLYQSFYKYVDHTLDDVDQQYTNKERSHA